MKDQPLVETRRFPYFYTSEKYLLEMSCYTTNVFFGGGGHSLCRAAGLIAAVKLFVHQETPYRNLALYSLTSNCPPSVSEAVFGPSPALFTGRLLSLVVLPTRPAPVLVPIGAVSRQHSCWVTLAPGPKTSSCPGSQLNFYFKAFCPSGNSTNHC